MSSWVHVAGIIRVDALRVISDIPDFDEIIGKECLWDDSYSIWEDAEKHPDAYLPMGSEGSLKKDIWINPNKNHMAAYTISIFGDLRDMYMEDAEEIIKWFKNKCNILCTRNAVITIRCGRTDITWTYEDD